MKLSVVLLLAAIVVLSVSVAAEEAKPKVQIPLCPGSEATLELGLAGDEVVPTLNAMLPMLAMGMGKGFEILDADTISSIFRDVTRIDVLTLEASKPRDNETSVAAFYSSKLPSGSWARVFATTSGANGTIQVYGKRAGEGLYGFRVRKDVVEGKTKVKAEIAKIEGKLDYTKLISIFTKIAGNAYEAFGQPKAEPAPAQ